MTPVTSSSEQVHLAGNQLRVNGSGPQFHSTANSSFGWRKECLWLETSSRYAVCSRGFGLQCIENCSLSRMASAAIRLSR